MSEKKACTALLNSEECALSEKKEKRKKRCQYRTLRKNLKIFEQFVITFSQLFILQHSATIRYS